MLKPCSSSSKSLIKISAAFQCPIPALDHTRENTMLPKNILQLIVQVVTSFFNVEGRYMLNASFRVQNMSLGSNGVDRVLSLQKIPMRLRGINFCTSSARFAPSFVRQPNGPKCTQTV